MSSNSQITIMNKSNSLMNPYGQTNINLTSSSVFFKTSGEFPLTSKFYIHGCQAWEEKHLRREGPVLQFYFAVQVGL